MENLWSGGFEVLVLMALVLAIKVGDYIQNKRSKK